MSFTLPHVVLENTHEKTRHAYVTGTESPEPGVRSEIRVELEMTGRRNVTQEETTRIEEISWLSSIHAFGGSS